MGFRDERKYIQESLEGGVWAFLKGGLGRRWGGLGVVFIQVSFFYFQEFCYGFELDFRLVGEVLYEFCGIQGSMERVVVSFFKFRVVQGFFWGLGYFVGFTLVWLFDMYILQIYVIGYEVIFIILIFQVKRCV